MPKGLNIESLRRINRGLVFKYIATQDLCSRVELAEKCNLTKMAITNIINEFLEKGLVVEHSESLRATRSSPIRLSLAPTAPKVLGLLIDRYCCQATVCDFTMRMIDTRSVVLPKRYTQEELLTAVYHITDGLLASYPDISGIGIGSIGPVDADNGIILNPTHFNGIKNLNIRELIQERYSLPAFLDHHYNCAALAEYYYGNGQGHSNLLYLGLTYGVGLGVLCGGKPYSSQNGYSSEIGHMTINFEGPLCDCGKRGCLSSYARVPKIIEAVEESPMIGEHMSFREICANSTVPAIDQILMKHIVNPLSYALSNTINLMNSNTILLGDDAVLLPDRYLGYLEQKINEMNITHDYRRVSVQRAMFDKTYNAAMCASNVVDRVFHGEILFN